jgi:hypothetical protein
MVHNSTISFQIQGIEKSKCFLRETPAELIADFAAWTGPTRTTGWGQNRSDDEHLRHSVSWVNAARNIGLAPIEAFRAPIYHSPNYRASGFFLCASFRLLRPSSWQ